MIPNLLCEKWKFKLIKSFDRNKVEKFSSEFEERETLTFARAVLSSNLDIQQTDIFIYDKWFISTLKNKFLLKPKILEL